MSGAPDLGARHPAASPSAQHGGSLTSWTSARLQSMGKAVPLHTLRTQPQSPFLSKDGQERGWLLLAGDSFI